MVASRGAQNARHFRTHRFPARLGSVCPGRVASPRDNAAGCSRVMALHRTPFQRSRPPATTGSRRRGHPPIAGIQRLMVWRSGEYRGGRRDLRGAERVALHPVAASLRESIRIVSRLIFRRVRLAKIIAVAVADQGEGSHDPAAAVTGKAGLPLRLRRTCSGQRCRWAASGAPAAPPHDRARRFPGGDRAGWRGHCVR